MYAYEYIIDPSYVFLTIHFTTSIKFVIPLVICFILVSDPKKYFHSESGLQKDCNLASDAKNPYPGQGKTISLKTSRSRHAFLLNKVFTSINLTVIEIKYSY